MDKGCLCLRSGHGSGGRRVFGPLLGLEKGAGAAGSVTISLSRDIYISHCLSLFLSPYISLGPACHERTQGRGNPDFTMVCPYARFAFFGPTAVGTLASPSDMWRFATNLGPGTLRGLLGSADSMSENDGSWVLGSPSEYSSSLPSAAFVWTSGVVEGAMAAFGIGVGGLVVSPAGRAWGEGGCGGSRSKGESFLPGAVPAAAAGTGYPPGRGHLRGPPYLPIRHSHGRGR